MRNEMGVVAGLESEVELWKGRWTEAEERRQGSDRSAARLGGEMLGVQRGDVTARTFPAVRPCPSRVEAGLRGVGR